MEGLVTPPINAMAQNYISDFHTQLDTHEPVIKNNDGEVVQIKVMRPSVNSSNKSFQYGRNLKEKKKESLKTPDIGARRSLSLSLSLSLSHTHTHSPLSSFFSLR
jgi:hypothetical protein